MQYNDDHEVQAQWNDAPVGMPTGLQDAPGMYAVSPNASPSTQSVRLCPDGKYRWAYELGLFRNPTILFLIWKIFGCIGVGLSLLMFVLAVFDNDGDLVETAEDFVDGIPFLLLGFVVMFAVLAIGYAIYAIINGGKYCVAFEMDDKGLTHRQMPSQVKKAEVIGMINVLAGVATGNATQAGIGLTSSRSELSSDFRAVRSIEGNRKRCVIKINEPFAKNQAYVEPSDYDFVMSYVMSHCPQAKVTER